MPNVPVVGGSSDPPGATAGGNEDGGRRVSLFGFYGGGEIGYKGNDTAPCGVGNHISSCAISTK